MGIFKNQSQYYREIFALQGFLQSPLLTIGFIDICDCEDLCDFCLPNLKEMLISYNIKDITVLDHFDPRADLRYDLNLPVPNNQHEKYMMLLDFGSLEHIFDTKQVLENCMRMIKVGGIYALNTSVNG